MLSEVAPSRSLLAGGTTVGSTNSPWSNLLLVQVNNTVVYLFHWCLLLNVASISAEFVSILMHRKEKLTAFQHKLPCYGEKQATSHGLVRQQPSINDS